MVSNNPRLPGNAPLSKWGNKELREETKDMNRGEHLTDKSELPELHSAAGLIETELNYSQN